MAVDIACWAFFGHRTAGGSEFIRGTPLPVPPRWTRLDRLRLPVGRDRGGSQDHD